MKLIWKEHKRTCQKNKATAATACTATDALVQEVSKVTVGKRSLWLKLQGPEQKLIAEYMDVVSMCRMDSAMTGREERKEWQKALKGLQSVAMNKWPRHNNLNKFAGLRWCIKRRIALRGFRIEKVFYQGYGDAPRKNNFFV